MRTENGESGGVDGLRGTLGFGAAVDGEEVDSGVLDGLDEVHCLTTIVSLSHLWKPNGMLGGGYRKSLCILIFTLTVLLPS